MLQRIIIAFFAILVFNILNNFPKDKKNDLVLVEVGEDDVMKRITEISQNLGIKRDWIYCAILFESGFDPNSVNEKSGAVGLIQFTNPAIKEINRVFKKKYTKKIILEMTDLQQLDVVEMYLELQVEKYGSFESFTDFYLSILCPKAVGQKYDFVLFSIPNIAYFQNKGLDFNRDGIIDKMDVERFMIEKYPECY